MGVGGLLEVHVVTSGLCIYLTTCMQIDVQNKKTGLANLLDEVTFGAECFANLWMAALHRGARSLWAKGGWLP